MLLKKDCDKVVYCLQFCTVPTLRTYFQRLLITEDGVNIEGETISNVRYADGTVVLYWRNLSKTSNGLWMLLRQKVRNGD